MLVKTEYLRLCFETYFCKTIDFVTIELVIIRIVVCKCEKHII